MNSFPMNAIITSTLNGTRLEVSHSPHKKESADISAFKVIGLLYRMSDELVEQLPQLYQVVRDYFTSRLRLFGFLEETVQILLSADSWNLRMRFAWYILDNVQKTKAQELDYEIYRNYWPTDIFCNSEWQEQVEGWILGDETGGDF